jgi:hypothetical protein
MIELNAILLTPRTSAERVLHAEELASVRTKKAVKFTDLKLIKRQMYDLHNPERVEYWTQQFGITDDPAYRPPHAPLIPCVAWRHRIRPAHPTPASTAGCGYRRFIAVGCGLRPRTRAAENAHPPPTSRKPRPHPALGLLIDRRPWWHIAWHEAPLTSSDTATPSLYAQGGKQTTPQPFI